MLTVPRLFILILIIGLTILVGQIPYAMYISPISGIKTLDSDGNFFMPMFIFGNVLLLGLLFSIRFICIKYLLVWTDSDNKMISFVYPFSFRLSRLSFDEITGFYFSEFSSAKGDKFKVLVIVSQTGETFKFSDLEISNFRQVEVYFFDNFKLIRKTTLEPFEENAKLSFQTKTNKKFDFEQAKHTRFTSLLALTICSLFGYFDFFEPFKGGQHFPLLFIYVDIGIACFVISRLAVAIKTIKNYSQH